MDCLHDLFPLDVVNVIQKYTSHLLCDDPFFQYMKNMDIHNKFVSHYEPGQMVEMFACYFNMEFMGLAHDTNIRSGLVNKLKHNHNLWINSYRGNHLVVNYVYYIHNKTNADKLFTNGVNLDFHIAWMNVYSWLTKLVEQQQKYRKYENSFCWKMPKKSAFLPNMTWTKSKLQQLLTDNGLMWYKSWNRKKLLTKWYKSKD